MKQSKKEERMLILTMVNEGKITVDESVRLLEALSAGENEFDDYAYTYEMEEKFNNFSSSLENLARDVGEKTKTVYKDLEPKLKNATKTVVEKTVSVLNDITKSLNESLQNMEQNDCYCGNDDCCSQQKNNGNGPAPKQEMPENEEPKNE